MNKNKQISIRKDYLAGLFLLTVLVSTMLMGAVYSVTGSTTITQGSFIEISDYLIWKDGSTYYSKNGDTGQVSSGTNATTVVQDAIDDLSYGLITLRGFDIPSGITHKDSVALLEMNDNGELTFYGLYGHEPIGNEMKVMRLVAVQNNSKPIIEWLDHNGNQVAWLVAHKYGVDDADHQHFSIETSTSTPNWLITRFEIGYGTDVAHVEFPDSYVEIDAGNMPIRKHYEKLSAYATNFTVQNLTISLNRVYEVMVRIDNRVAQSIDLSLYINGNTTDSAYYTQTLAVDDTTISGYRANNATILTMPQYSGAVIEGQIWKDVSGYIRGIFHCNREDVDQIEYAECAWGFNDDVDDLTEFALVSSVADAIQANSEIIVISKSRLES